MKISACLGFRYSVLEFDIMYNRKDYYYKKAKEEGRASRASYKLEQIQARFHVIKKADKIVDLGCAPGGWLEVVSEMVGEKGIVVGIDLLPLKIGLKKNMKFIQGDITATESISNISDLVNGKADVVISDMAPNTSGVAFKDAYLSYELCMMALETAKVLLKDSGNFVSKIFQGEEVEGFKKELKKYFSKVDTYVPPATREASKELYIVAKGFKSA